MSIISKMDYQLIKNSTDEKFSCQNFKPGDVFSEMLSYWEVIVKVELHQIYVIQKTSHKLELKKFTKEEYIKHCSYQSGYPGYWIDYIKTDSDIIMRYVDAYIEQEDMTLEEARDLKLQLIL